MAVDGVHAWESELGRGVASEVAPGLYLGDRETAAAPPPWRWRAVLNVTQTLADAHGASSGGLVFERIAVADTEAEDLAAHFERAFDFIAAHAGDDGGGVLVHCASGMSRSAAVLIGFLIARRGRSLRDAYAEVRSVRPMIIPNPGFFAQLQALEARARGGGDDGGASAPPPSMTTFDHDVERLAHPYKEFDRARAIALLSARGGDYAAALEQLVAERETAG